MDYKSGTSICNEVREQITLPLEHWKLIKLQKDTFEVKNLSLREEIGLLKSKLNSTIRSLEEETDKNVALRAEVEQLRMAVGLATTMHPKLEMDVAHPLEMMLSITDHVNNSHHKLKSDLAAAVELIAKMRGQWVHSMHKDECLELLARMEVRP